MPNPFHMAMRVDRCPQEPNTERALLEQRARMALADERAQRREGAGRSKCRLRSGVPMGITALRVACAIGFLLLALYALTSTASAMPGSWPRVAAIGGDEMRSGGGQVVAKAGAPGSGHHYTGDQLLQQAAIQPGNVFDWADASVGAGFTVVLGLLVAGGAFVSGRRRVHGQLSAGSGG
ncbi:MAG: hypothetical protein QOE87_4356 [Gaiellales bacterium]|nr:hypothetical protein [Gaiellales bacterium]